MCTSAGGNGHGRGIVGDDIILHHHRGCIGVVATDVHSAAVAAAPLAAATDSNRLSRHVADDGVAGQGGVDHASDPEATATPIAAPGAQGDVALNVVVS